MVARYWGGTATVDDCQAAMGGGSQGVTALMIAQAARAMGFTVQAFRHTLQGLAQTPLPAIIHWQGVHFVVLEGWSAQAIKIIDPAVGRRTLTPVEFAAGYSGVTLALTPTTDFAARMQAKGQRGGAALWRAYLRRLGTVPGSRALLWQLVVASLLYQLAGLSLPAVTWLVVESILPAANAWQLTVLGAGMVVALVAQSVVSYVRATLVIRLQQQLDSRLIPDFFAHLLRLPYPFFQQRTTGDLLTRLEGNTASRELLMSGVLTGLLDGGLALLYLTILYAQAPRFGLIVTVVALGQFLLLARSGERIHEESRLLLATQAEEESFAVQVLRGIETIKAAGTESWILAQ
jgi:ABC-type bacteriocin/lantibiotic exporter with double-glycine peptidase domain